MADELDRFTEALQADVVIPLADPGALSVTEALALRSWYDHRMEAIRQDRQQ